MSPGGGRLLAFQTGPASTAKDRPTIVHLELEKPPVPYTFEERRESDESVEAEAEADGGDKVIGKCFGASFPVSFGTWT